MLQLYRTNPLLIFEYAIYGERHSGTNFLEQCMNSCFDIPRTNFYCSKHFFGWTKPVTITYKARHVLFIGIVRNPYDWIKSMFIEPHHIHPHRLWKFKTFITSEWSSVHHSFQEIMEDRNFLTKERYKNIFELRQVKYNYLLNTMPTIAQNYVLISYEHFIKNHKNILNIIGEKFHLKKVGEPPESIVKYPYELPHDIKEIIDSNLDWNLEEAFGYTRR